MFWVHYQVQVQDKEGGSIVAGAPQGHEVKVFFDYLAEGYDLVQTALGEDLTAVSSNLKGKALIENSDCKACHGLTSKSVGPSYMEVAKRYKGKDSKAVLAAKVIKGGYGKWGEVPMSAHPQLSQEEGEEMVDYILRLADSKSNLKPLPVTGTLVTNQHKGKEGTYFLTASYTDKGHNGVAPITTREILTLRHPGIDPSTCDASKGVMIRKDTGRVRFTEDGSYITFKGIDLTGISGLTINVVPAKVTATLEMHTASPAGPIISKASLLANEKESAYTVKLKPTTGVHDLYFVLKVEKKEAIGIWNTLDIEQIEFWKARGSTVNR